MDRYKCPYKFAIDYLIRNGIKLEEKNNNFGRQVVKLAIEALEKQREKEVEKMKKYECLKLEGDAEIYEVNGKYIKVVWGYSTGSEAGIHNTFDTNVCVYKWTGEDCTVDELPGAMDSDWKAVVGFDLATKENSYGNPEVDWEEYAKKVDEMLAEIEEEQTKEEQKMKIEVWMEDEKTGIKCGLNCDGKLFLGDNKSGYNLHDNPENRERVINDFCRYTGRQKPVIMANGKPYKGNETIIEFSR